LPSAVTVRRVIDFCRRKSCSQPVNTWLGVSADATPWSPDVGHRQPFASWRFMVATANNSLAFPAHQSDESSCANQAQKGFTTMTNAEATITENAATVAAQSAHVAPEKASSKKGCQPEEGRAQGPESRQGQSPGRAEEASQSRQEGRKAPRPRRPACRAPRARARRSCK
jgi:hypothetical protein